MERLFPNRFDAGWKDDCLFKIAAVKRFVSYRFQSIRQRNFCQVMRIHKRLLFDFPQRGRQADGRHIRTLERAFADLRHALWDHDLCFQASHKCK